MQPAASVEVTHHHRTRARVHVDPHPAMFELTVLSFVTETGSVELSLSPENLDRLLLLAGERLAEIRQADLGEVTA